MLLLLLGVLLLEGVLVLLLLLGVLLLEGVLVLLLLLDELLLEGVLVLLLLLGVLLLEGVLVLLLLFDELLFAGVLVLLLLLGALFLLDVPVLVEPLDVAVDGRVVRAAPLSFTVALRVVEPLCQSLETRLWVETPSVACRLGCAVFVASPVAGVSRTNPLSVARTVASVERTAFSRVVAVPVRALLIDSRVVALRLVVASRVPVAVPLSRRVLAAAPLSGVISRKLARLCAPLVALRVANDLSG
jgi:hypothetical protein